METFHSLELPEQLMRSLERLNFNTPTPIQAKVIPAALEGRDILGSAQTGTGKTGAFGIPTVAHLMSDAEASALVITPTRELAIQVMKMLENLTGGRQGRIRPALLIGGEAVFKQLKQLRAKPRLIVGTPGRINDHLKRKTLKLDAARFLILDEADRMLDMGFTPQIESIVACMPKERQTLLFSATLPKNILKLSANYLTDPFKVSLAANTIQAKNLNQEVMHVKEAEKYERLTDQLGKRNGSVIIFVKTKIGADRMAKRLRQEAHSADALHGNQSHNKRERTIRNFRDEKYRILVATDIAARGLDIDHVRHVVNFDLPQSPEDYIHRVGRTARAGAEGESLCFVTPSDRRKWSAINRLLGGEEDTPRDPHNGPRRKGRPDFSRNKGPRGRIENKGHKRGPRSEERPGGFKGKRFERGGEPNKKRSTFSNWKPGQAPGKRPSAAKRPARKVLKIG